MPPAQYLELPATLDSQASAHLLAQILALRGCDLELGASAVRRLGGQCLQILLAARTTWTADGHVVSLIDISTECAASLSLFGVKSDLSIAAEEVRS